DRALRLYVDWSLIQELKADESKSRLKRIEVVQPALFAIQVALAGLWRFWGIEPDYIVGHSMGEIAASYVAGALTLEDAARVICLRSKLLSQMSGLGAMALVELSIEESRDVILGYEDEVSIAVSNSPRTTVLSGNPGAMKEIINTLERKGIFCRWI